MVDPSIEDGNNKVRLSWVKKAEFWTEKIMSSFWGDLARKAHDEICDAEVDNSLRSSISVTLIAKPGAIFIFFRAEITSSILKSAI